MFACEPSAADPTFRRVFVTDRLRCALPLPQQTAFLAESGAIDAVILFAPSCKPASTARGLPFLRAVLDRAHAPVFALGGITDENERLIREAGAAGACRMADYARRRGVRQAAPCKYERSRG